MSSSSSYILSLSATSHPTSHPNPDVSTPVALYLEVKCNHRRALQLKSFDLCSLLTFPTAEQAITTILSNSAFNASDCNPLRHYLSSFVHQAAIAARENETESLFVSLGIRVFLNRPEAKEESEIERELAGSCPVCLDDFRFCDGEEIKSTPCWHVFHAECIGRWLDCNSHCPVCRYDVLS